MGIVVATWWGESMGQGVSVTTGEGIAIDALPRSDALKSMLNSHHAAIAAVELALPEIDAAAELLASRLGGGAVLCYAAAGSSGLMALADASELAGTFRIPQAQVRICMAGGVPVGAHMPGDTEDDTQEAQAAASALRAGDVVIAVSASGATPYVLAFVRAAQQRGATVIAIANVAGSLLLDLAEIAICLKTAPEVVAGSTRLGAATAQKVALNMISTQLGILLGHVHDGLMVNLNPENIKLRKRAADIVCKIADVDPARAQAALLASEYDTKQAILIASGVSAERATALLADSGGSLGECFRQIKNTENGLKNQGREK